MTPASNANMSNTLHWQPQQRQHTFIENKFREMKKKNLWNTFAFISIFMGESSLTDFFLFWRCHSLVPTTWLLHRYKCCCASLCSFQPHAYICIIHLVVLCIKKPTYPRTKKRRNRKTTHQLSTNICYIQHARSSERHTHENCSCTILIKTTTRKCTDHTYAATWRLCVL